MIYESSVLFINTAKSLIWLLRMNKLITKYNVLAQCKPDTVSSKPMADQKQLISDSVENWRGYLEKIDDVCVIGV